MTSSRVLVEASFVLHHRPYQDSSLIIDAFTKGFGRCALVAKGARRAKSKWRGLLQPFSPLLLSWTGKGELFTLIGAELHSPPALLKHINLAVGFYVNELVLRLLHRHDPHPRLFDRYSNIIRDLEQNLSPRNYEKNAIERELRLFEKEFLSELGYGLILDYETDSGDPILDARRYQYVIEKGPIYANTASTTGIPISGSSLLSYSRGDLSDVISLKEVKLLTRCHIEHHLGSKRLNSREYFNSLYAVVTNKNK